MVNLTFVHVYQQMIELTQQGELQWQQLAVKEFPYLDPDAVTSHIYKTVFRNRHIILFQQRVSLNRGITQSEVVCDFVDANHKKIGEMPRAHGIKELYRLAMLQNREQRLIDLDKVVAMLTEMTLEKKVTWSANEAKDFPDLDPEVVSSNVYELEYRGRRFITFLELGVPAKDGQEDIATLWSVDSNRRKVADLKGADGIPELFQAVRLRAGQPDMTKLDKAIDGLLASTLPQLVEAIKAERARQQASKN